jgi:adenosylcobyric acid synthase
VICRHLYRKGIDVIPFKGLNLSSKTHTLDSGLEIGIGQALQAWACGKEPSVDMNPILLKPENGRILQIVKGTVLENDRKLDRTELLEYSCESYDDLSECHEMIICEGSGSPSEINIQSTDIANIGIVRKRSMDIILIGDIERGGLFASVYGTWLLTPEDIRPRLKGFVINRFRGDVSILYSGIRRIEELTGMVCLGVMPYVDIDLPEEDHTTVGRVNICQKDLISEYLKSIDAITDIAEDNLRFDLLDSFIR